MLRVHQCQVAPVIESLHPTEAKLIAFLRDLGHGTVEIKVLAGHPVMIEVALKQIKLT